MPQRRMTRAIERIADDRKFAARFREDPEGTLRRYRLRDDEIEAIKRGDAGSLAAHGVDVRSFATGRRRGLRSRLRRVGTVAAMALGALGVAAAPASAARFAGRRMGTRLDGIWSLGDAQERAADEADIGGQMWQVEVPTDGVPGNGRPFEAHGGKG